MVTVTTHYTCANGHRIRLRGSLSAVLTTLKTVWRNALPPEADMDRDARFSTDRGLPGEPVRIAPHRRADIGPVVALPGRSPAGAGIRRTAGAA